MVIIPSPTCPVKRHLSHQLPSKHVLLYIHETCNLAAWFHTSVTILDRSIYATNARIKLDNFFERGLNISGG